MSELIQQSVYNKSRKDKFLFVLTLPKAMRDMFSKVRRFGKLTEKQIDFMVNLQADDVARRAKGGEAPEGFLSVPSEDLRV